MAYWGRDVASLSIFFAERYNPQPLDDVKLSRRDRLYTCRRKFTASWCRDRIYPVVCDWIFHRVGGRKIDRGPS